MTEPLAQALKTWAGAPGEASVAQVHAALLDAVVLLPVRAVALAEQPAERTGLPAEREAELSLLTVALPDGRRVLPVFTDPDAVRRWQLEARPVQATMRSACQAVVDEGWDGIVVDPAGSAFVVEPAVVAAVAAGALPVVGTATGPPSWSDDELADLLRRGVAREPAVAAAWLLGTRPVTVGLRLKVPLDAAALDTIAERLGRRLDPSGRTRPAVVPVAPGDEPAAGALWP